LWKNISSKGTCYKIFFLTWTDPLVGEKIIHLTWTYTTWTFGIETIYNYYIAMKSMFFVAKLFYHPSIVYASLTFFLPWSKHKQHQNHSKPKAFQNQNFNSRKFCIHTITLYKWRCLPRSQTPLYILTKNKLIKKLLKVYPPHDSANNQKETKSHGSPCDSTINHKETKSHGSPCNSTINHKVTKSHGSACDSTINHKETKSHGSPCDSSTNHKGT